MTFSRVQWVKIRLKSRDAFNAFIALNQTSREVCRWVGTLSGLQESDNLL